MMLSPMMAMAYDAEIDGIYYNLVTKAKTAEVTYSNPLYNSYSGSIEIPSTVDYEDVTYNVISIGDNAFNKCSGLTSISILANITNIGNNAFDKCTNLQSVAIPNSVVSIGNSAFRGCSNLQSVSLSNNLEKISSSMFSDCIKLTYIDIPSSVTSIDGYAFNGCSELFTLTIGDNVSSIGERAFYGCIKLDHLSIPEKTLSIGGGAFYGCTNLVKAEFASIEHLCSIAFGVGSTNLLPESNPLYYSKHLYVNGKDDEVTDVVIPNNVTSVSSRAFQGCEYITSVSIGSNVETVGSFAFMGCCRLESLSFPNNVKNIGAGVFSGCTGLQSVSLPQDIISISYLSFYNCSGLKSIVIPANVKTIGSDAFRGCSGLLKAEFASIEHLCGITFSVDQTSNPLYAAKHLYINGEEIIDVEIPKTVTSIGKYAFYNCQSILSVTLPSTIKTIGNSAFQKCKNITDVICYAENVPTLGSGAFSEVYPEYSTLHVPSSAIDEYRTNWSVFESIVPIEANIVANNANGSYWSTYYNSQYNYSVDENTVAFAASYNAVNNTLSLTPVEDNIIKAGHGVVLKSSSENLVLTYTPLPATDYFFTNNNLSGVDVSTPTSSISGIVYVLGNGSDGLGFYKYAGENLNGHKSFMSLDYSQSAPTRVLFIVDDDTAVAQMVVSDVKQTPSVVYDLQGKIVDATTKGIYIVSGKKKLFK